MEKKTLDVPLLIKAVQEDGAFEGYASVFNVVDSQKDAVQHGAFARTLQEQDCACIKLLWQHRMDEPIGVIEELREDPVGLYVKGRLLLEVQRAKEAYALLKSGALNGLSIGYRVQQSDIEPSSGVRMLQDIDLFEVSLVTFPANAHAGVTSVKNNAPDTVRGFEHFLREAGFSRKHARDIALHGFDAVQENLREAGSEAWIAADEAFDKAISILHT